MITIYWGKERAGRPCPWHFLPPPNYTHAAAWNHWRKEEKTIHEYFTNVSVSSGRSLFLFLTKKRRKKSMIAFLCGTVCLGGLCTRPSLGRKKYVPRTVGQKQGQGKVEFSWQCLWPLNLSLSPFQVFAFSRQVFFSSLVCSLSPFLIRRIVTKRGNI